jgi:hypothetical protein
MNDHKKMLWIRHFNKVSSINDQNLFDGYYEHEIASECQISGELDYKDKSIIFLRFLTPKKDKEGLYHYLVRVKSIKEECEISNGASESGYSYKGLTDELMALMSVFFRCRFYKIATYCIFSDGNKIKTTYDIPYRSVNKNLNKYIFDEDFPRNFGDFKNFLNLIENLKPDAHQSLIRSCDFYLTALKEIGIHRDISYIRLVSAIECLLKDNNQIQKKFVRFVQEHSKYSCDKQNHGPLLYVTEDVFPEILKRIYNARSRYLHDGKPMYLNLEINNNDKDWHFDASCGSIIDGWERAAKEKLPYESWFEEVVNRSIKNFLEKNQIN